MTNVCREKHVLVTTKMILWHLPPVIRNSTVILMVNDENVFKTRVVVMWGFSSDTSPLLNRSSSEHMFDTMAMEIEQLLTKVINQ